MKLDKIKMTKQEFEDSYEIEDIIKDVKEATKTEEKEEEVDDFLSEEEQEIDIKFHQDYPVEEEPNA